MSLMSFLVRFLSLLTMALWAGGFTFYSAVVIPELHDAMGDLEAGYVTQRVTVTLNVIGIVTVVTWWALAAVEWRPVRGWFGCTRLGLLAATTVILATLSVLHRTMDERLDASQFRAFYPLHRAYLIASTVQWVANLGLLASAVATWGHGRAQTRSE